ncbi:hypothetical protein EDB85DRAFT_2295831 [Lactarius pseudohatsudake]|nr:hypothetical protein EDB85DRAFT_2295831 [Lactarius pseudohatsudake]
MRMPALRAGGVGEAGTWLCGAGPRLDLCGRRLLCLKRRARATREDDEVKHYDADDVLVLMKAVVYVGIDAIATVMVPALFEALK